MGDEPVRTGSQVPVGHPVVYMLHLDRPIWSGRIQHYTGWTSNLPRRIWDHLHSSRKGSSGVTWQAKKEGVGFQVAVVVSPGTRRDEVRLKSGNARNFCPVCLPGVNFEEVIRGSGVVGKVILLPDVDPMPRERKKKTIEL